MANDYFQFKNFIVHQQLCGMKVGTDGTLLGAWAQASSDTSRILDIGTGTGLIALMMAQRYPESTVTGIDIDMDSVVQARNNVIESPFSNRIIIENADVTEYEDGVGYDAIVCNPPFFVDSLESPDKQRSIARHTITLTYEGLVKAAYRLLKPNGLFSVIIPTDSLSTFEAAVYTEGFHVARKFLVKTTPQKPPKRVLIEMRKCSVNEMVINNIVLEESPNVRSKWYQQLIQDFYIK